MSRKIGVFMDNVGLLCGDEKADVKVFVTLDTNINTVKEAISKMPI